MSTRQKTAKRGRKTEEQIPRTRTKILSFYGGENKRK